jgi:predicted permease
LLVQPPALQPILDFHLDLRVLLFSVAVSLATVAFFGLAPAWRTSKSDLVTSLKERASSAERPGRGLQPRHWLSVSQISISLILLAGTGLLVQSFLNSRTLNGLGRKPLLETWLFATGRQTSTLYREALDRVRAFPSVKEVAFASRAPLSLSEGGMSQLITFPEHPETSNQPVEIKYNSISSNYLQLMGTALLRGRFFSQLDQTSGPPVALISETMARRFWPQEDPIGKIIRLKNEKEQDCRIVGVVQDVPINAIGEKPEPYLYLPYWRNPTDSFTMVIETGPDPLALAQPIRRRLLAVSHDLDPFMITTQSELVRYAAGQYQITAELVSALGFLGLSLTAVGLYGVISYGVSQRVREIGIRMALGAERGAVLATVLREVAVLGAIGIGFGLPLAFSFARSASALLFGVTPWDWLAFSSAIAVLVVALFAAGIVPANRATRVDPVRALREDG